MLAPVLLSLLLAAPGPKVVLLERSPAEPLASEAVMIRARVEGGEARRVEVHWEVRERARFSEPGRAGSASLKESGGVWTGTIPPVPGGGLVRFRIEAVDASGARGVFPGEKDPPSAAAYLVLHRAIPSSEDLLVLHLLWTGELRCEKGAWTMGSVLAHRGRLWEVGLKYRGDSSCGRPKTGIRASFDRGDIFPGLAEGPEAPMRKLNLLAGWEDRALMREKLAWDLFRDLGAPHFRAEMAAVLDADGFHGLFIALEDPGARWLRRSGLRGELWKCRSALRSPSPSERRAFEKVAGAIDPGDDALLEDLARRLQAHRGRDHLDLLLREVDVEAMIDLQAVKCLISDEDGFRKNWLLFHGVRDELGDDQVRWTALPWDLDLSFGQTALMDERIVTRTHPLRGTIDHARHGTSQARYGMGWNGLIEAMFGRRSEDHFVKALYGRIWSLLEEKFDPLILGERIDRLEAATAELARADLQRWPRWGTAHDDPDHHRRALRRYVEARHRHLRQFLTTENPTVLGEDGPRSFRYIPAPRIRFTEVHFSSGEPSLQFVELRSLEKERVDLSGWDIPLMGFAFPAGSDIAPGGTLVVARDPERLRAHHRGLQGVEVLGPCPRTLPERAGDLRLRDSGLHQGRRLHPETIDAVRYRTGAPWPEPAKGRSLELRATALDNDLPQSWKPSAMEGGTPGAGPSGAR